MYELLVSDECEGSPDDFMEGFVKHNLEEREKDPATFLAKYLMKKQESVMEER